MCIVCLVAVGLHHTQLKILYFVVSNSNLIASDWTSLSDAVRSPLFISLLIYLKTTCSCF